MSTSVTFNAIHGASWAGEIINTTINTYIVWVAATNSIQDVTSTLVGDRIAIARATGGVAIGEEPWAFAPTLPNRVQAGTLGISAICNTVEVTDGAVFAYPIIVTCASTCFEVANTVATARVGAGLQGAIGWWCGNKRRGTNTKPSGELTYTVCSATAHLLGVLGQGPITTHNSALGTIEANPPGVTSAYTTERVTSTTTTR